MQRFDLTTIAPTPWKNGGGATRELACWPAGADMEQFDWRVSVATIAQSGPFSRFAGVDRIITLLTGDGVHLRQPGTGIDHRLDQPLQPFAFAGDGGMECDLLGGTSTDFNLMTRRGRWQGAVQVLRGLAVLPARPAGLLGGPGPLDRGARCAGRVAGAGAAYRPVVGRWGLRLARRAGCQRAGPRTPARAIGARCAPSDAGHGVEPRFRAAKPVR